MRTISLKLKSIIGHSNKTVFFLFGAFQVFVFLPALRDSNPWSDDWTYIYFVDDFNRSVLHDAIASGRPILGIVDQFAYQSKLIANNLIILQILSLSALLILQLAVYSKLIKNGFGYQISFFTSLALILIPGFQGYVYFISCFPYSWACLFGYLSYSHISNSARNRKTIGFILLTCSFLIYPTGAMFYFLGYFIDFTCRFTQENKFQSNITHLLRTFLNLALCSAVSLLIGKLVRTFYGTEQSSRIEFVSNLENFIDKVVWASTRLFVSEFRIFTVASPSVIRAAIEASVLFSLFALIILKPIKSLTWNRACNFCLLFIIPLLGAIPNLIIRENQFEFRTLTATYAMSLILWAFFLQQFLKQVNFNKVLKNKNVNQNSQRVIGFCGALLVLLAFFYVQLDSRNLWIKPSLARDKVTQESLKNLETFNKSSICMVIPEQVYLPLKKLGVYSMRSDLVSDWVPGPYMKQQLENFNLNINREIIVLKEIGDCDPSSIVIDYTVLAGSN